LDTASVASSVREIAFSDLTSHPARRLQLLLFASSRSLILTFFCIVVEEAEDIGIESRLIPDRDISNHDYQKDECSGLLRYEEPSQVQN
jgi:hypothetical protein